jgi:parallel beta-helix repeat protein
MRLLQSLYFKSIILLILSLSYFTEVLYADELSSFSIVAISPADGPSITDGPYAQSRHMGNNAGDFQYGLRFYLSVSDPQGFSDIASVVVTGPTGIKYTITDSGNNGWYDLWIGNLTTPPPFGVYTFRITDKSANWIEATDNINAVIDYPKNAVPANYSVISSPTPQFSWTAVTGAVRYHVQVINSANNVIWNKDNITTGPVTFNDDASATENLVNGNQYQWGIYCTDADGNRGEQYFWIPFIYSTNLVSPILTNQSAKSAHYGNDSGYEEYVLSLGIQVYDPQGFSDIASIKVTGTGGSVYQLTDNNNDGYYDGWFSGLSAPPQAGSYIFRATDKSGNWTEKVEVMTGSIGFPGNVHPAENEVISTSVPVFSWDPVAGSARNEIWVSDNYGKTIWSMGDPTGSSTSVTFNYDGSASELLKDGSIYFLTIKAIDSNGNWGERSGLRFAYSSNTAKPIIGNHDATTHINADILENEDRGYDFWVDVIDPQGLADIASVTVLAPGGTIHTLTDPNSDGRYNGGSGSIQSPYPLGQCQFTVTDKSGNISTVLDTLYAWVQFPRNIKPVNNELVTSSPVFSWDAVSGISYYQIHVWKQNGPIVWGGVNIYDNTSATYNFNGTGQPLQEGSRYSWDIRTYDSKGNVGYHYGGEFIFSSSTTAPILSNIMANSAHYGDDTGSETFYLSLSVQLADPQGLSDIATVTVTGPDLKTYSLTDNNNDGVYDGWFGGTSNPPAIGAYIFRVVDKSGNWKEATDNVSAILNYPKNLKPLKNEVVSTPTPAFSWDAIPGAKYYRVWVNKINGYGIWSVGDLTTTSVVYNFNGSSTINLIDGQGYSLNVQGYDADGNFGEQSNQIFYYSTNLTNPILTDYFVRSRHWVQGDFSESWGIDYWTNVADPQGLSDIDSVWITGPGNIRAKLYDDNTNGDGTGNDGVFSYSQGGFTAPPVTGEYIFNAVDKSGHLVSRKDTLTRVLDYARDLNIKHNSIVSDSAFAISWSKVEGAKRYEAYVQITNGGWIPWSSGRGLTQPSTSYNSNNTGTYLSEGDAYYMTILAEDDNKNESVRTGVKFVFRTDNRQTIYVDTLNKSGIEDGTSVNPYNTLNEAIERSITADTVFVSPGIYQGGINDIGSITLIGKDPLTTIIRGGYIGMRSSNSSISGFSIKESGRVGIEIHADSNIVISNNIISDNQQHGIVLGWSGPVSAIIRNNTIVNNTWNGISIENDASEVIITNNIISHNGSGISNTTGSLVNNSYNDIYGNNNDLLNLEKGTGDIFKDPLYTDRQGKKYTLTSSSPALDSGDPDSDMDGKDWTADSDDRDPDTTRMDMGAVFLDQRILIPNTPVKLSSVSCNNLVTLKWNKNIGPYFLRYRIYGGTSPNPLTKIDSTSNNIADTTKIISGLTHGQTYYFKVVAVNRGGKTSDYSIQTQAKIQTGVIPKIKSKWSGDVLICYNQGDSIAKYQWYKGGATVSNGNGQYYTANKQSGSYYVETIDKNSCKNTSNVISVSGTKSLTVYPNPASSSIALKINDDTEGTAVVSIINSMGKKIKEFQTENTLGEIFEEIPVAELEEGIYYINVIMSNKESYSAKIIISR